MVIFTVLAILLSVPRIFPSAVVIARTVPIRALSQRSGEPSCSRSQLRGAGDIETEYLRRRYCRGTRDDTNTTAAAFVHHDCPCESEVALVPESDCHRATGTGRWRWCRTLMLPTIGRVTRTMRCLVQRAAVEAVARVI
jgi:hypothetical protein